VGIKNNSLEKFIEIDIEKLVKAEWNYKEEDAELQQKLVNNIKANGQIENIIIRELDTGFYEVVNGNHRYDALKELGFDKAIAYNLGKVSQAQARRIAISTNETKFKANQEKFIDLMNELIDEFSVEDLVQDMPYSEEQLVNFKNLKEFDWKDPTNSKSDSDNDSVKVTFHLPKDIAEGLQNQIQRINSLLYPNDPIKDVQPIMAIQVITQIVAEYPDESIIGKE